MGIVQGLKNAVTESAVYMSTCFAFAFCEKLYGSAEKTPADVQAMLLKMLATLPPSWEDCVRRQKEINKYVRQLILLGMERDLRKGWST